MGCGKSTLGKKLANNLDFNFALCLNTVSSINAPARLEVFINNGPLGKEPPSALCKNHNVCSLCPNGRLVTYKKCKLYF